VKIFKILLFLKRTVLQTIEISEGWSNWEQFKHGLGFIGSSMSPRKQWKLDDSWWCNFQSKLDPMLFRCREHQPSHLKIMVPSKGLQIFSELSLIIVDNNLQNW